MSVNRIDMLVVNFGDYGIFQNGIIDFDDDLSPGKIVEFGENYRFFVSFVLTQGRGEGATKIVGARFKQNSQRAETIDFIEWVKKTWSKVTDPHLISLCS